MTPALVACAAWTAGLTAAMVLAPAQQVVGAVAAVGAVLALPCALVLRPLALPLAVLAALLGVARAELPPWDTQIQARAAGYAGASVSLVGRVADDPKPAGAGLEVLVSPVRMVSSAGSLPQLGKLLVRTQLDSSAAYGDEVRAAGRLALPADTPGFARRAYLAQRSAFLVLNTSRLEVQARASGVARWPAAVRRHYLDTASAHLPPPYSDLLVGVVLGIRTGIPADLKRDLTQTGLVHLLVLSGLKVAVFCRLLMTFMAPVAGRASAWLILPMVAGYAVVGGATPAAVRAALMGGLTLLGSNLGRPSHVWTSLALAAAGMVGVDPALIWDVGFQLSFVGTAAIVVLTGPIESRLQWIWHWFREPFAVTCAAQLGTVPLMAKDFHLLSLIGPPANALVLPLLPAMVTLGLLLPLAALLGPAGQALGLLVVGLLTYLEQVATLLARIPAAAIEVPDFPISAAVAYYGMLSAAVIGLRLRGTARLAVLLMGPLSTVLVGGIELARWTHAETSVSVLAVGDGQAVLLSGPGGRVLIDGGSSPNQLRSEIGRRLPPWERRLAAIAITAPGAGHVGGLAGGEPPAELLMLPAGVPVGGAMRGVLLAEQARGARPVPLVAGETISVGDFSLQALAPEPSDPGDEPGTGYLALRAVGPSGRAFCSLSDLDRQAQQGAAQRLRGRCDYLLLPDGGRSAPAPELMQRAQPSRLLASRGSGRLARELGGLLLARTDQEGTITLPI